MAVIVSTNGAPKCGNHALVKACQLLGLQCQVQHLPHPAYVVSPGIVIKRHPRDVLVSMARWLGRGTDDAALLATLADFHEGQALVPTLSAYTAWLSEPAVHVVAFEDLVASPAALRAIAAHCGVPCRPGAWVRLPGLTLTWTGALSRHADLWTPALDAAWALAGGRQLQEDWGYPCNS